MADIAQASSSVRASATGIVQPLFAFGFQEADPAQKILKTRI